MKKIFVICSLFFMSHTSLLASSAQELVLEAANSLQFLSKSGKIPQKVLKQSRAVVVVPASVKVSFFLGGKYGRGVASIKKSDGNWSQPFFVKLGGGSLGLQFGVETAHTLLIFRTSQSVGKLLEDKFTLGAGASVSAGPLSKNYERKMEVDMSAEILTYSKTGGLFAGASLEGTMISHDKETNSELYSKQITAKEILSLDNQSDTYSIEQFLQELQEATR